MGANGKRVPIAVRGRLVRSATVGSLVFVETLDGTTRRLYASHVDWAPPLDPISIGRVRQAWERGDLTQDELAVMFSCHRSTIDRCVHGRDEFAHLPPVVKGSITYASGAPTVWSRSFLRVVDVARFS